MKAKNQHLARNASPVIPAKAGIQCLIRNPTVVINPSIAIPANAGNALQQPFGLIIHGLLPFARTVIVRTNGRGFPRSRE
ncbi:hypothetical protein [[Pseudomonas] boreopolis]|uniref:hypothetical protein n=1 Tax=Xanthomonas boreopolis TaxID=86183 RepID=UPI003D9FDBA1